MKISTREKYFVFGGIGVLLLIGLFFFGDRLTPGDTQDNTSLEFKKRRLMQYRQVLTEEDAYRTRLEQYKERLKQYEAMFLPGDNPSIAGAELQKVLSEIAARIGVDISRKDIQREQKVQDDLIKVSVRIDTNSQPQQLVQFISQIENHEKFLSVDELVINSFRMQRAFEIRPALTVSGYLRSPDTKAGAKPETAENRSGQ